MNKIRNKKMTVTFDPNEYMGSDIIWKGEFKCGSHIRFKDKSIIISELSSDDNYDLTNFLNGDKNNVSFEFDCDICVSIDDDQIQYQIDKFMDTYSVTQEEFFVSYKASLVHQGLFESCRDIDLIITRELSYRLEDEFGIIRSPAPMGNTSKQVIGDIELYTITEEDYTIIKEDCGIRWETPESIIHKYREMNRLKDVDTIKNIETYLTENDKHD